MSSDRLRRCVGCSCSKDGTSVLEREMMTIIIRYTTTQNSCMNVELKADKKQRFDLKTYQ